jgi:hypothetical protein
MAIGRGSWGPADVDADVDADIDADTDDVVATKAGGGS